MASLMAQRDDRIKSLALLFSGADLADIVMTKKEGNKKWEASLGRFRAGLAQATGNEDPDHLKEYLENAFADVEPLRGVDDMRDLPTFMANPRKDELIPKTAGRRLSVGHGERQRGSLVASYVVPFDFHVPTKRKILTLMLFHLKSAIDAMHRLDSSGTFLEGHFERSRISGLHRRVKGLIVRKIISLLLSVVLVSLSVEPAFSQVRAIAVESFASRVGPVALPRVAAITAGALSGTSSLTLNISAPSLASAPAWSVASLPISAAASPAQFAAAAPAAALAAAPAHAAASVLVSVAAGERRLSRRAVFVAFPSRRRFGGKCRGASG